MNYLLFYIDLYGKNKARHAANIREFAEILETDTANLMEIGMVDEAFIHLKSTEKYITNTAR